MGVGVGQDWPWQWLQPVSLHFLPHLSAPVCSPPRGCRVTVADANPGLTYLFWERTVNFLGLAMSWARVRASVQAVRTGEGERFEVGGICGG